MSIDGLYSNRDPLVRSLCMGSHTYSNTWQGSASKLLLTSARNDAEYHHDSERHFSGLACMEFLEGKAGLHPSSQRANQCESCRSMKKIYKYSVAVNQIVTCLVASLDLDYPRTKINTSPQMSFS